MAQQIIKMSKKYTQQPAVVPGGMILGFLKEIEKLEQEIQELKNDKISNKIKK